MSWIINRMEITIEEKPNTLDKFLWKRDLVARPKVNVNKIEEWIDHAFNERHNHRLSLDDFVAIENGRLTCAINPQDEDKHYHYDIYIMKMEDPTVEEMVEELDVYKY